MNIGIVAPYYFPNIKGGGEISLKILSEALTENGYNVVVITFDGEKKKEELISGVRVIRYSGISKIGLSLTLLPQVLLVLKRFERKVDLFHMYNMSTIPGAGLYKFLGGRRPVVATLNSYIAFCPIGYALCLVKNMTCSLANRIKCMNRRKVAPKIFSLLYAFVYPLLTSLSKKLDAYIAPSKAIKHVYTCIGYPSDKIEVAPYSVHTTSIINKDGCPKSFDILYVGKLDVHKGVDILIQAFSSVTMYHKNTRLIIVGDGPEFESYVKLVSNLGISSKVYFTGKVNTSQIWKYYSIADVFVHPAIWIEPFGRTILEALSFQLPIIVSNIGAPAEIIKEAGLVFESGNINDLVQKLKLVIENTSLRKRLTSNCSKVLEEYRTKDLLDRIVRVYARITKNRKQGHCSKNELCGRTQYGK